MAPLQTNPKSQIPNPNWQGATSGRGFMLAAGCLLVVLAGCSQPGPDVGPPLEGVSLRLLVVGDAELAAAAAQWRGEWTAQTGGQFEIVAIAEKELESAETLDADAVICPSGQLGLLAERKWSAPLPKPVWSDGSAEWTGVFELLRLREASWGSDAHAVPFGSPVLVCYYRRDLLAAAGRRPPQTWAEYQQLAELLSERSNLGQAAPPEGAPWSATLEPLGPGWAGLTLLSRAAPYAKHRNNYSTVFNIQTMEPLIDGPPWVHALQELVAAARLGPPEQLQYDPHAVRNAFWEGRCAMALTWPTAATPSHPAPSKDLPVGFVELPGSRRVFDVGNRTWDTRAENDDPHVPVLGIAGRIGVVAAGSAHPDATLQLLLWLSGDEFSGHVAAASRATTLFRRSHLSSPQQWTEPTVPPAAAAEYAAITERTLQRVQWLSALPIPGRAEYLAALDDAVQRAARGELPAVEALRQAAVRWEAITKRLGVEQQRAAYRHSLGLE